MASFTAILVIWAAFGQLSEALGKQKIYDSHVILILSGNSNAKEEYFLFYLFLPMVAPQSRTDLQGTMLIYTELFN